MSLANLNFRRREQRRAPVFHNGYVTRSRLSALAHADPRAGEAFGAALAHAPRGPLPLVPSFM